MRKSLNTRYGVHDRDTHAPWVTRALRVRHLANRPHALNVSVAKWPGRYRMTLMGRWVRQYVFAANALGALEATERIMRTWDQRGLRCRWRWAPKRRPAKLAGTNMWAVDVWCAR